MIRDNAMATKVLLEKVEKILTKQMMVKLHQQVGAIIKGEVL